MLKMRALKRLPWPTCVPEVLAISLLFSQSASAQSDNQMLTPEQLRSFQTTFDGEGRPELVPLALKVRDAISAYESLERLNTAFTPRDREVTSAFRSAVPTAAQEDAQLLDTMYRDLCERIDRMDGESAAAALADMDKATLERWEARTQTYLASLTAAAAKAVLSEAEELGRTIKGNSTNLAALARQYPDFVKQRIRATCVSRGFLAEIPR